MNPLDAHAQGLGEVQAELTGSVTYNGSNIPAIVGIFRQQQVLDAKGGGFKPMTMATVVLRKSDLPKNTIFKSNQGIFVQGYNSQQYNCNIYSVEDQFTSLKLTVRDIAQNA